MATLAALIARAAAWYGPRVAVADLTGRRLTFTEVERRSNRLANALSTLVRPGATVALLLPNVLEFVEIDLALIKAGCVKVPINPRLAADERDFILRDAAAGLVVAHASESEYAVAAIERLGLDTPLLVVGADDDRHTSPGLHYEAVLDAASPVFAPARRSPDKTLSQLLYTSGTTGRPKGAAHTEQLRIDAARRMLLDEIADAGPTDAMAHVASMAHGSGSKTIAYYLRGARNVPIRRFDPEQFVKESVAHQLTCTFMVPSMIAMLLDAVGQNRPPGPVPLRTITYGGAPMPLHLIESAIDHLGPVLVQVYGTSETPHPLCVLRKEHHLPLHDPDQRTSTGRESAFHSLDILDPTGAPVLPGVVGELAVPVGQAMSRYWNAPEETAQVISNGYYWTGDQARRDQHGFIHIVGRNRDLIISGGYNVYPAEVERVLHAHPLVREAVVAGSPDERWGEVVTAWVVPAGPVSLDELQAYCDQHLAGYKRPRVVHFVEQLPKGSTGKVLKNQLVRP